MKPHATIQKRTFHYAWCGRTETDYTCTKCGAIVVESTCLHCARAKAKAAARLQAFLASRQHEA